MLLIVCVSNPVDAVGIAELTGIDVTGASVESSCFSSSDKKINPKHLCNHWFVSRRTQKPEQRSSDGRLLVG